MQHELLCLGARRAHLAYWFQIGYSDDLSESAEHPRNGIPCHGDPDLQPEGGGEYFRSRGVGVDRTPGCFVCGGEEDFHNNIAAFVQCKDAGARVVAMFTQGARLDYRPNEPDRVQVKIGACDRHLTALKKLNRLTRDGIITPTLVEEARSE